MDPKNQLSGLDPKLKEAYERVMGTTIPPASPPPAPPQEPATSLPTSQTEPLPSPANQTSEPAPAQPPPVQEPSQEPPPQPEPPPVPPAQPSIAPAEPVPSPVQSVQPTGFVANASKKEKLVGLKLSRPILMAVGAALLVLYIFFWMRVFNLSFPF